MTNLTSSESLVPESGLFTYLPRWLVIPSIIISILEILLGTIGNSLVIIVISCIGKSNVPHRTHNYFIVNLALSDLVLCLFTMPLNIYRSLNVYMTFPPAFCKLTDSFPAINVCVSSLTIVAISIYRYLFVCYPHKKLVGSCLTFTIMVGIWLLAIAAASPLFIYSHSSLVYDDFTIESMVQMLCSKPTNDSCKDDHWKMYKRFHVCHESWPEHGDWRLLYTIFIFFLQFILPISIICITYYQVMVKLRERFRYRFLIKRHNIASLRHEIRRQRRNNVLLLLIVASYAISWLPFNISYTIFTYANRYPDQSVNLKILTKYLPFRFLICMISAITNPFLYGYYNETFKDGLEKIFAMCYRSSTRDHKSVYYEHADAQTLELTFQKHQNGGLASRSSFYQLSSHAYSLNSVAVRPSTHLTMTSANQLTPSFGVSN